MKHFYTCSGLSTIDVCVKNAGVVWCHYIMSVIRREKKKQQKKTLWFYLCYTSASYLTRFVWRSHLDVCHREDLVPSPCLCCHSAGVGRTGTFIVIDSMIDMMHMEQRVDVFGFVSRIREQRCQLIQTDVSVDPPRPRRCLGLTARLTVAA